MPVTQDVRYMVDVAASGARFRRVGGATGYAMRDHDSPHRVSRIGGQAQFWDDCARTARFVRDHWRARGEPLTPDRTDVITAVLLNAAEAFARAEQTERLDRALQDLRELDSNFTRRVRRPHRTLLPLLGYRRTVALVDSVRRVRDSLRGR
jgi:hypothetical protein